MSNIQKHLQGLNEEELKAALEILENLQGGEKDGFTQLYEKDFREIPVSPEEFLDNPYYYQHVGKSLYPVWRQNFIDLYRDDYYHVIITGAIGIGKDFFVLVCLVYELYKIGCLRDPHAFFGRADNTDIIISLVSITKTQTKKILFDGFKNGIDGSPWFRENFPRDFNKNEELEFRSPKAIRSGLSMGAIRVMYGAPNNSTVIGSNVITAAIDEANFMEVVSDSRKGKGTNKQFNQAQELYNNIYRRMESRFLKLGKMPGKLFILSSRQYPDDFVEKKLKELRGKHGVFIREYSLWEVNRDAYFDETFLVDIGDNRYPPRVLRDGEEPRQDAEIIEVPIDFIQAFETDIEGALRDIAGIASLATSTFIKQRDKLFACIDNNIYNIFQADKSTLMDGLWLDPLVIETLDREPIRAIHLDLASSKDSAGMAMLHCGGYKTVDRIQELREADGTTKMYPVSEVLPIFVADLILEIPPPLNGEINYALIRQIIFELRDIYNFNIGVISADQYQSKDTLQILSANGFETAYISTDRTLEPYYSLRTAINEARFKGMPHEKFYDELSKLEEDYKKKKIDHRQGHSKDVSDAVAGAMHGLLQLEVLEAGIISINPSKGIEDLSALYNVSVKDVEESFDEEVFLTINNNFEDSILHGRI